MDMTKLTPEMRKIFKDRCAELLGDATMQTELDFLRKSGKTEEEIRKFVGILAFGTLYGWQNKVGVE